MALDGAQIAAQLNVPELMPALLTSVDSTNDWLKHRVLDGHAVRAVVAAEQRAGRGRRGRAWHSPAGQGLYLSLAWPCQAPASQLGALPLVAGLAAARAIQLTCAAPVQLKWPNDLWLAGAKLGGCLVELSTHPRQQALWAIIGVGINLQFDDATDIDQAWTDLARHGHRADLNTLAAAVINALQEQLSAFEAKQSFAPFRGPWQALDALRGQAVVVSEANGQRLHGRAEGVDEGGRLVLITADGARQSINTGEVSLRLATST